MGKELPTGDYMPPHPEVHHGPCERAICDIQTCLRGHNFDEHECYPVICKYIECAHKNPDFYYVPEKEEIYLKENLHVGH